MNTSKIAAVAGGVISLIETGQHIYEIAAKAMDVIEQNKAMSGSDKKAWALAYIKSRVIDLGENWSVYAAHITKFIDQIKAAYNAVKSLFE